MARAWIIPTLFAALQCGTALCQELAFTSRTYLRCPVVITSVEHSTAYGFDSVVLLNDGSSPISAVHFQITLRAGGEDEIIDERRVAVNIDPRDSKRLTIELARIEAIRQRAKSREQASALVIITIESVEFQDGGVWKETERNGGVHYDPVRAVEPTK
jgi:hypothetical protein